MKRLATLFIVMLGLVSFTTSVNAQESKDSLDAQILEIMSDKLSKCNQLELLEMALMSEFDVQYEMKQVLESLNREETEDLLIKAMRKAGMPVRVKPTGEYAKVNWQEVEYDFGYLPKGKKVSHVFQFENFGDVPFKIEDVYSSCGCTVTDYPETPIAPGTKGQIVVTFDSTEKPRGLNNEFVTVTGNTFPRKATLIIMATVR